MESSAPPPLPPDQQMSQPYPQQKRMGDDLGMRMLLPVGRSGLAIAAGYLGLFSLMILPAPIAIIVSILAIIDIRRSRGTEHPKHGMGRAVFGLVAGIIGCALPLVFILSR